MLIALCAVTVFLYWVSLYLYVPTLPNFVETKTDALAMVGIVLAQYGLWQALIRLPLGIASDWLGWHKPFLVVGFGLSALGAFTLGVAGNVEQMAVGRAITGLAAGTWVPLVVVFNGLFPPDQAVRATSMLTFVASAGRVLATSVTGSLNEYGGYSLAFFLAAGAAGLAILIVLPAQIRRRQRKRPSVGGIGRLITRKDVLLPSLLAAVNQYTNWGTTFGFMPILARDLGANDVTLSMLLSLNIAMVLTGNLVASAISVRIGGRRLSYLSFALLAGGVALASVAPSLLVVFIAQVIMGLSQGIGYPVLMAMSIRYVDEQNRTTAMGLHQAVYAIGMFSGPWLSGILADAMGIQPMFGVTAAAVLLVGIAGARLLPRGQ
jgi:MFS family permease